MLSVHLICVGKLKEKFYIEACGEYVKRLSAYCKLQITELPEERLPQAPSRAQIDAALEREAAAIRAKLPPSASLVALCVEGKLRSSEELARLMDDWSQNSAKHLVFLIGGSYGLHPSIKAEAWVKLSMSPMTFPHHLARVMLLEQIYRGFKISEGSSYHK
ncbi:MAG: 23S rRNA (pseudouridine(1915)-N(3))-methyltransferase RlmH [Pseudoflavonifractor sp.]|nr:23S rRNA (pseudouridine(1915)-N(3))-methyltransferase RlmH [Pseudoflavonifractor sp.]